MKKKLRSSKGMTMTELLVALAVVALIGMSLAMGVSSAAKVYRDSTRLSEAETLCGTILTYLEDEFRYSRNVHNITTTDSSDPSISNNKVIFTSQVYGADVGVILEGGKVMISGNAVSGNTVSQNEGYKLIADAAYTSGLMVQDCEISYEKESGQVTITIAVGPDNTTVYAVHTVKVTPVDN